MHGGVFINYRKGPHTGLVEALHRTLVTEFGKDQVFLDMQGINPGADYREELERRVREAHVVLVVIDPEWLTRKDKDGVRLIDRDED